MHNLLLAGQYTNMLNLLLEGQHTNKEHETRSYVDACFHKYFENSVLFVQDKARLERTETRKYLYYELCRVWVMYWYEQKLLVCSHYQLLYIYILYISGQTHSQ